MEPETSHKTVRILADSRDQFLKFLRSRIAPPEAAEDVLQSAYTKALDRGAEIRNPEGAVAWFYRLLRNAVADYYRHHSVEVRALRWKSELPAEAPAAEIPELARRVCQCWREVLPTLKPEYSEILRKADLEGVPLSQIAEADGTSVNSATVRLHRARKVLRDRLAELCGDCCADGGCLDCDCPPHHATS